MNEITDVIAPAALVVAVIALIVALRALAVAQRSARQTNSGPQLSTGTVLNGGMTSSLPQQTPASNNTSRTTVTMDASKYEISAEVLDLVRAGQHVAAIKVLKDQTGLGLAEAKRAVDGIRQAIDGGASL